MFTIIFLIVLLVITVLFFLGWKYDVEIFDFDRDEHLAGVVVAGVLAFIITTCSGTYSVDEGEAVILTKFGKVYSVESEPDLHLKRPWAKTISWDTRLKTIRGDRFVYTRDNLKVVIHFTVWWKVDVKNLNLLYANITEDFDILEPKFIEPVISFAIRSIVIKIDGDELNTNGGTYASIIKNEISKNLQDKYIIIDKVTITDIIYMENERVKGIE